MTTIKELREDMRIALRLGNKLEVEVLRGIISAAQKAAIDKRCEITVGLIDEVLVKEQKTIQEMIDSCPESRTELLKEYKNRIKNNKRNISNSFNTILYGVISRIYTFNN